jgi:hypothetical protein
MSKRIILNDIKDMTPDSVKLLITKEMEKMRSALIGEIDNIFTQKIKPAFDHAVHEVAEMAADNAIKKYCTRIGIDFDSVEHMQHHNLDMAFLRSMRIKHENVKNVILTTIVKTFFTAIISSSITYLMLRTIT